MMRKDGSMKAVSNTDQLLDRLSQNNVSVGRKYLGPILIVLCVFVLSFLLMESSNLDRPSSTNIGFRNTNNRKCLQTCQSVRTKRLDLFDGRDLLNRNDIKKQISDAKDRLIVKLEKDYGKEYFSKIFKNEDGSFRPFVPISDESMKRLKRKLLIKILSVQTALKQKENKLSGGCDCFAESDSDAILMRKLETPSIPENNDLRIETTHAKYVWATGGHSAAASHGNLYNESYTAYLESDVKDVFQSIGIDFEGRNYAMGGTESAAEMAMCWQEIFGDDVDWFSWDYGMTDAGKPYRLFHYGYRGGTSRGRPGFTAIRINRADKNIATEQLKTLEEVVGIPVFVEDADMFSLMREEVPDSAGLSSEQLRNLPDFVRNFKCNGVVEKGEPYCEEEKYSSHLCQDREGKAPWHPGYKTHAMLGHSIALFLVEALASAIDDFLKYEFTDHHELLNRLTTEEESAYNTVINKTEDIQDFPSKLYSFDADEDLNASGLDPFLLFNGSSICHTARLPSRTRYLGYLTDTDKQGGPAIFGQEEYEVGTELDEAMKDFNETALQLVWEDDKFHQKDCPTIISPDHKDYFFTQAGRGWSELMFPNDAEKNAYRYDPTNHQGLMILVFRKCDWGQCEEGYLGAEDLTEEKEWEMKINGEPVVKLIDIGHLAFIAKGKNGMKFTPNEAGTYKIEIQVNEPSHFVKISSFVIY